MTDATRLTDAGQAAVRSFALAVPLVVVGLLGAVGVFGDPTTVWLIVCIILLLIGLGLLGMALSIMVSASRWSRLRRGPWQRLEVTVKPDQADGQLAKTVLQTKDESFRILLLRYPLHLRDRVQSDGSVEYVGTLEHDGDLLVRPVDGTADTELFGHVKSMARLQAERG